MNNAKRINLGNLTLYFSYETLVAIYDNGLKVIENCWGPTTGKHINAIDGGSIEARARRLSADEFAKCTNRLNQVIGEINRLL